MRSMLVPVLVVVAAMSVVMAGAANPMFAGDFSGLSKLTPGRVRAENALWIENPKDRQFTASKEVLIAELAGPGVISMIHFAMPQLSVAKPKEYTLSRDLVIRMYWDGEAQPSVDCPMVDFFCDPAGMREQVNTALVNKRQGYNAYFPMPYRKSAKLMLVYEGPEEPGDKLWAMMPCYSYVVYRQVDVIPADEGYLHARWHQQGVLMGKDDYPALRAEGRGKFVGWNVTVRLPGSPGYPVDMNEKFYIDGEEEPSIEFQGIEDSFGFSWGYPPSENIFPLTGYWPFMQGAMAYRFFINDAISFDKSLRVDIGFGKTEKVFQDMFSKRGSMMQLSSVCYWYQTEPHAPFSPMLPAAERAPAPEERFWPEKEPALPTEQSLRERKVGLLMLCGRPEKEVIFAEPGFDAKVTQGYGFAGWLPPVYHCLADDNELRIELTVPKGKTGTLRLHILDSDHFQGGRRQRVFVDDRDLGEFAGFEDGKWIETRITENMSRDGVLPIRARDLTEKANAVISIIEWIGD